MLPKSGILTRAVPLALLSLLAGSLSLASCSGESFSSGSAGNAGHAGKAGSAAGGGDSSGTGGKAGSGTSGHAGSSARGGSGGTGGSSATGGTANGGSGGTGGSSATGGTGGSSATGGTANGGTGGTSGNAGTGGSQSPEDHPAAVLIAGICDTYRACCETAGFFDHPLEHCERQLSVDADAYRTSIAQGRLSIDNALLTSCATYVRNSYLGCAWLSSLSETLASFSDCIDGIRGHVETGDRCDFDEECVGAGAGRVQCVDGACRDVAIGEDGDRCIETAALRASYLIPAAARADGGAACRSKDGLYCRATSTTEYACAPVKADGQDCQDDEECGPSSFCATTCKPTKESGASCTVVSECGSLLCSVDTRTCTELPDRASCEDP